MTVVFKLIADALPVSFLHPDLFDFAAEDKSVAVRRGTLFTILSHPTWNRLTMLNQLVERTTSIRKTSPEDWAHWMFCIFGLVELLLHRILGDIRQVLRDNDMEVQFKSYIATDEEMMSSVTQKYRDSLRTWKNEDDRPPFTKHDCWMAVLQDKEMMDGFLASPSILLDERARRVMENYCVSMRDARLVVATMEQLGGVIDLKNDSEPDSGDDV